MFSARRNDKGFTLVELMMVIVILGVLAGVAIPLLSGMKEDAWTAKLQAAADAVGTAVIYEATNTGEAPTTVAQLEALVNIPADIVIGIAEATCTAASDGCLLYTYVADATSATITPYYEGTAAGTALPYKW